MSDPMARFNRLLRVWAVGERCTAVVSIFYAVHDLEIRVSALGTVERVEASRVLGIRWDDHRDVVASTSPDNVNPWRECLLCLLCGKETAELCPDGGCRACHVSLSFEECCDGSWAARLRRDAGLT